MHLADHAVPDQFSQPRNLRMATVHIGFHEEDVFLPCCLDKQGYLGLVQTGRFFDQNRLSGSDGQKSMLGMKGMRG